jgi:protein-L-isoaspartate(D-aspartate) O-methyltransferase
MSLYEKKREEMLRVIRQKGLNDARVLDAMRKVPRHKFVPAAIALDSYRDSPLPIGYGQTISQPYIVALMSSLADIHEGGKVLEIGTGSGYQAAVLAELGATVFTIERHRQLWEKADKLFRELGYSGKIVTRNGDGTLGWKSLSPFDAIVVTASGPEIPLTLLEQLKKGGRMVIPVGGKYSQELLLLKKDGDGKIIKKKVTGVAFVPLIGKEGWKNDERK